MNEVAWECKLKIIECVTLSNRGTYCDMFKYIKIIIWNRAFLNAEGCDKMPHFVCIIHEKHHYVIKSYTKGRAKETKGTVKLIDQI